MQNVRLIDFRFIKDPDHSEFFGGLVPIEGGGDIPFDIKRVYNISGMTSNARRGFHSHRDLHQVLIALGGSIKILVKTPFEQEIYTLNKPWQGLYIGPMIWREMFDFQDERATLLVLASEHYNEADYIRDYQTYVKEARKYFGSKETK